MDAIARWSGIEFYLINYDIKTRYYERWFQIGDDPIKVFSYNDYLPSSVTDVVLISPYFGSSGKSAIIEES